AAIRAPSGDNTQPWRFVLDQDRNRIAVYVDETRDSSPMNTGQHMARIACGGAVENMLRMARAKGWDARLEAGSAGALAVITVKQLGEGGQAHGGDEETIAARVTNRRLYERRAVPD